MKTELPDQLVRIAKIIGPNGIIPVCRSTFYQGIRDGIYPPPLKLGKRVSAWRLSELLRVVQNERPP
jgi:prophage regulatory protein